MSSNSKNIPQHSLKVHFGRYLTSLGTREVESQKFQDCCRGMKLFYRVIFVVHLENELRIKKSILPVRVILSNSGTVMRIHPTTLKITNKITKIFGLFLKVNLLFQNCQNFRNKKIFKTV